MKSECHILSLMLMGRNPAFSGGGKRSVPKKKPGFFVASRTVRKLFDLLILNNQVFLSFLRKQESTYPGNAASAFLSFLLSQE
ncbi:Uncharacterized protein dnm_065920 [Desulfonema magnum]|uniref:Uncharacterized protein n=1 Tax=Desulfonema magnum TaxID=45655 RepID=A0A975BRY7_9BACT|nr:Uncharacterized protein dnm_065920 [Desulfonema magnum]